MGGIMKAVAPGKLILSGEHSVVYGCPALAMAVNRNAETVVEMGGTDGIAFDLPDVAEGKMSFTEHALREFHTRAKRAYDDFLAGKLSIREVLKKPVDLFQFAYITVLDGLHVKAQNGLTVRMHSNIPIGCGMGSSAASILSVLRGLGHYYRVEFRPEWYRRYGLEVENLQHGKSSGLDTYVSMHGGCVMYREGEAEEMPLPRMPLYIVNTGRPESTTGEAVSEVARRTGGRGARTWADFEDVTERMRKAVEGDDFRGFRRAVRENERLLEGLGVVPGKVAEFAREIEEEGGGAKICGAGSVRGEGGGMVLVTAKESPAAICAKYGYEMMTVRPDPLGVRMV